MDQSLHTVMRSLKGVGNGWRVRVCGAQAVSSQPGTHNITGNNTAGGPRTD